jgi:methionyl-tRNA formyltransferase
MRIVILGQEEPVYFSPFLRSVIVAKSKEIVLVVIAGNRGAGNHPDSVKKKIENIQTLWLIMEPYGFVRHLFLGIWYALLRLLGPFGSAFDRRSICGAAGKFNIPVITVNDVHDSDFIKTLKECRPDIIINQTELLLKEEIISIPKLGIINRHASLLPHFRGRLGSFWSHFSEPPEYGTTIHFVNNDIDAGGIIVQRKYHIDPRSSYTKVLDTLFKDAPSLMLHALELIQKEEFVPLSNSFEGTHTYVFPTLQQAQAYKVLLKKRRGGGSP